MQLEFTKSFIKQTQLLPKSAKNTLNQIIEELETSFDLAGIKNLKKLRSSKKDPKLYYRIRIGDYRAGFYMENNTISFRIVAHRGEIYKNFP